jgi:hypothetical protein
MFESRITGRRPTSGNHGQHRPEKELHEREEVAKTQPAGRARRVTAEKTGMSVGSSEMIMPSAIISSATVRRKKVRAALRVFICRQNFDTTCA